MLKTVVYCAMLVFFPVYFVDFVAFADAQSPTRGNIDIDGIYLSDKQAIYHIKQMNSTVWILGTSAPSNESGTTIASIFSGTIGDNNNKITGKWIESPLFNDTKSGNAEFDLLIDNPSKNITLTKVSSTVSSASSAGSNSSYPANVLTRYDPVLHRPLTFYVSIENILINVPRSPTTDFLYVGLSGQKNDDNPLTATKYLGPREDGSNITANLRIGPFSFNSDNDSLRVKILGIDREGSTTPFTFISLRDTLIELMNPSYNVSDMVQAANTISSMSPGMIEGECNGLVFIDEIALPYGILRNLTASDGEHTLEKTYRGTISPPGCGAPSQYAVKVSITAQ